MKSIFLTGSAGFIGFHTALRLLEEGWQVIGADNLNRYYDPRLKQARNKILLRHKNYKFYKCDIADYSKLEKIFQKEKFTKICHLAAQAGVRYSLENPFAYARSNIDGFLNILELARKYRIKNIVYASSSSVYGGNVKLPFAESDRTDAPVSLYAATKKSNELMAQAYHMLYRLNLVGLRFFTVYGPWGRPDMALFKFTRKILAGEAIEVYNRGQMARDFTYIDDIVDGIVSALSKTQDLGCAIFNLGGHKPEPLAALIRTLEKTLGKKAKPKLLPMQDGDMLQTYADIRQARKILNYAPKCALETGVKNFVEWYKNYYKIL